ncbi:MAG: hypothetical protein M1820_000132 [Bogoriella megaspora]|nr:MAG: hypothetical protein M1820_000132 [Bogoriella megaspora]
MSLKQALCIGLSVLMLHSGTSIAHSHYRRASNSTGSVITANFDDLSPEEAATALNTYSSLVYTDIEYKTFGINGTTLVGTPAPSKPNAAVYGSIQSLALSQGSYKADLPTIDPSISAGPGCSSFQLKSFYGACSLALPTGGFGIPIACDITLTGYAEDGNIVDVQTYAFEPYGQLYSKFQKFDTSDFKPVKTIKFETNGVLGEEIISTALDNLEYVVNNGSGVGRRHL